MNFDIYPYPYVKLIWKPLIQRKSKLSHVESIVRGEDDIGVVQHVVVLQGRHHLVNHDID